ncbi:MAG: serine/threonine protein kinase, partial [Gemmatimonadota bacterium]|nr:serine/threonine protein kinase [Gemmatimonadota bacterium]
MGAENLSGRTIASYRLLERIGEGGTATVYRAEHAERGTCAVKILRERMRADKIAVKRFLREADYGARVCHENVVTTYDFGEEDGLFYLALEWAEGEPLADYAERAGSLEPSLVAHIMAQLAGAIAVAHEAGIVHRDLKPENIMFDPKARVAKLLDFGIARDQQEDPSERLTRSGFFVGSLNYVAPEALSGALVGESADTYSLATIAYYLLTTEHPYGGRSPREIFQQLLTQPPQPIRETTVGSRLSPAIAATIMRSLSREPAERHPSIRAFADD